MAISRIWTFAAIAAGLVFGAAPARAESPGLYYAWRTLEADVVACIDRSTTALSNQGLGNIQVEGNSVAGTTEDSTAVFVCLESLDDLTVMIMVSSNNDDTAFELRETLKTSF
ncbi:MAG: hypothetical protein ACFBSG_15720 [Leptolyngbyaceae cyanobacterium]